nr:DMT family transporter [Vibrio neptunius]
MASVGSVNSTVYRCAGGGYGDSVFEKKPFSSIKKHLGQLTKSAFLWLLGAIFVGTFLALWLQQIALKHANPAIAQTLIATSPVFMLGIYVVKGEKVTAKSIIGTLAAIVGVSLFFLP